MKALVTGAAGFIGSHLAEALCRRGFKVLALDNLSSGSLENLSWKKPGDALEFIQGDICDRPLLKKLLADCDWIFHQAAIASVPYSVAEPERTNRENLDAVLALLEEVRASRVKRLVFASSCSIYGDLPRPAVEADPPNPLSPYALQKYAAERYVRLYCDLYQVPGVSLRDFNVFGPRQSASSPYSGVIARFCEALLAGRAPVIFGDGLQSRDFISVYDIVRANLLAAENDQAIGQVFNIGSGASTTLLDLVRVLSQFSGRNLTPDHQPPRPGDVRFSRADISAARTGLGFDPAVSLEAGLRETFQFYQARP